MLPGATRTSSSPFLDLTSLPLYPPHRPSLLSTVTYPSLVASPAWQNRFDLLQVLGEKDQHGGGWGARGHTVDRDAICIWSPGVEDALRDDGSKVMSPGLGFGLSEVIDTGHGANIFSVKFAPGMSNRLFSCAGDSTVRVFDLSLATNPQLSSVTIRPPASSGHRPWTHHEDATACTRIFRCHFDRVKRVANEASPEVFLTCSEDGTVRQHDLREHHTCRTSRMQAPDEVDCPPPLASYPNLSLYSLTISKLRPHLFVVAGTSPYAYLHDRRMLRTPMLRDWGIVPPSDPSSSSLTQCVRRFGVPHPSTPHKGEISHHIVAAKLSPDSPRDLLLSYSTAGIYLFDTDGETYERPPPPPPQSKHSKGKQRAEDDSDEREDQTKAEDATGTPVEETPSSAAESPTSTSPHLFGAYEHKRSAKKRSVARSAGSSTGGLPHKRARDEGSEGVDDEEEGAGTAGESHERGDGEVGEEALHGEGHADEGANENEDSGDQEELMEDSDGEQEAEIEDGGSGEDDEDGEDGDEEEDDFLPRGRGRQYHADVPMVAPRQSYTGHANTQASTVKDVNFLNRHTVISGSDDGNFFTWDRETGEVLGIWKGDDSVVNVMTPSPTLPIVAISGIEETVKLFGPTADLAAAVKANLAKDYERIKARNARGETGTSFPRIAPRDFLAMLFANAQDVGDEAEGEEEGERMHPPRRPMRRIRIVRGNPDDPAADCAVM
ncbi:WD repeat protein [Rhodotorula toruloides]|uniref:WD repeat protein n=1 Tax=Rhodotorula toruloides TaxID=5286 RepID=A0A511KLF0_RHOTO|nr:WD repeat protein [Rhodotorula toruloides]